MNNETTEVGELIEFTDLNINRFSCLESINSSRSYTKRNWYGTKFLVDSGEEKLKEFYNLLQRTCGDNRYCLSSFDSTSDGHSSVYVFFEQEQDAIMVKLTYGS